MTRSSVYYGQIIKLMLQQSLWRAQNIVCKRGKKLSYIKEKVEPVGTSAVTRSKQVIIKLVPLARALEHRTGVFIFMEKWLQLISRTRLPLYKHIFKLVLVRGQGLEVGSGSSAFGITASKIASVTNVTCTDISAERQHEAQNFFLPRLGGDSAKMKFVVADFHSLPFQENDFDFVLVDAALHHSDNPTKLMAELRRVLKPGGVVIAVREPILPTLPVLKQWRKMTFGWRQRQSGDIENIYTQKEWATLFAGAGLQLTLIPVYSLATAKEKLLRTLKNFNGILFNRYAFIAN